jgi:hypothetical protein
LPGAYTAHSAQDLPRAVALCAGTFRNADMIVGELRRYVNTDAHKMTLVQVPQLKVDFEHIEKTVR